MFQGDTKRYRPSTAPKSAAKARMVPQPSLVANNRGIPSDVEVRVRQAMYAGGAADIPPNLRNQSPSEAFYAHEGEVLCFYSRAVAERAGTAEHAGSVLVSGGRMGDAAVITSLDNMTAKELRAMTFCGLVKNHRGVESDRSLPIQHSAVTTALSSLVRLGGNHLMNTAHPGSSLYWTYPDLKHKNPFMPIPNVPRSGRPHLYAISPMVLSILGGILAGASFASGSADFFEENVDLKNLVRIIARDFNVEFYDKTRKQRDRGEMIHLFSAYIPAWLCTHFVGTSAQRTERGGLPFAHITMSRFSTNFLSRKDSLGSENGPVMEILLDVSKDFFFSELEIALGGGSQQLRRGNAVVLDDDKHAGEGEGDSHGETAAPSLLNQAPDNGSRNQASLDQASTARVLLGEDQQRISALNPPDAGSVQGQAAQSSARPGSARRRNLQTEQSDSQ